MNRYMAMRMFALAGLVLVTGAVQAAELKIGFVNALRLLEEAPQAEAARSELEKEFAPRDAKLAAAQKEVKQIEERLTREGDIMSEAERRKLERDVLARSRDLKREQDEFREDLNIRRNEISERLRRHIHEVIVALSKKDQYDLIVSDGVVFASDRVDITDTVLSALKAESQKTSTKSVK